MKRVFLLLVCMGNLLKVLAIAPPLEREITLSLTNEPIKSALTKIQEQTGLIFSYRASIIDNVSRVTFQLKQKTVREALALILPKNVSYKSKNNYIILKEKPVDKNYKKTELSGYVIDANTERKLSNVTIYDKKTLQSVTTDEFGYYTIKLPNENQCLNVNKENYKDTCVPVNQENNFTNISINLLSDSIIARDSVNWRSRIKDFSERTNNFFKKFKGHINTLNVKDTISRNFQTSIIPFLGTNGLLSGNVYNKYSVNVFGGYSRGTDALELGGFFNVNREKMKGLQAAGFFNIVGDSMSGVQLAGFFNIVGKKVKGAQAAGFFNFNLKDLEGFQGAGFVNFNLGKVKGLQTAGFVNANIKGVEGICVAGILNANRFSVKGVQIAGMLNLTADTIEGSSLSGFANLNWYSKKSLEVSGFLNHAQNGEKNKQLSGFMNSTSKGTTYLQIAGFLNIADKLQGLQLGLYNYADTASGVPIGLLSIVKKGLHQFELSSDEIFPTNIGFRTGVNKFYNVFTAGMQMGSGRPLWNVGYGVGTSFKIKNKLRGDITATAHHVSKGSFYYATSEMYKFYLGLEYKFMNKFSIAAGPTFNLYLSDALLPDYTGTYSKIIPYNTFVKPLPDDFNLKGWVGGRVSLRFL